MCNFEIPPGIIFTTDLNCQGYLGRGQHIVKYCNSCWVSSKENINITSHTSQTNSSYHVYWHEKSCEPSLQTILENNVDIVDLHKGLCILYTNLEKWFQKLTKTWRIKKTGGQEKTNSSERTRVSRGRGGKFRFLDHWLVVFLIYDQVTTMQSSKKTKKMSGILIKVWKCPHSIFLWKIYKNGRFSERKLFKSSYSFIYCQLS